MILARNRGGAHDETMNTRRPTVDGRPRRQERRRLVGRIDARAECADAARHDVRRTGD
jgi:hypothetical protein